MRIQRSIDVNASAAGAWALLADGFGNEAGWTTVIDGSYLVGDRVGVGKIRADAQIVLPWWLVPLGPVVSLGAGSDVRDPAVGWPESVRTPLHNVVVKPGEFAFRLPRGTDPDGLLGACTISDGLGERHDHGVPDAHHFATGRLDAWNLLRCNARRRTDGDRTRQGDRRHRGRNE
jgi:hypothetical protein